MNLDHLFCGCSKTRINSGNKIFDMFRLNEKVRGKFVKLKWDPDVDVCGVCGVFGEVAEHRCIDAVAGGVRDVLWFRSEGVVGVVHFEADGDDEGDLNSERKGFAAAVALSHRFEALALAT